MSAEARLKARNAEAVAKRRALEHADALHFLVYGHDEHVERGCVHDVVCSRNYDATPDVPVDVALYAGTSIGALYGLTPPVMSRVWRDDDGEPVVVTYSPLAELAGWNVSIPDNAPQEEA